jgi:hypothetical protein
MAAASAPLWAQAPDNAKLCHRLDARQITDDDAISPADRLEWVRLEFAAAISPGRSARNNRGSRVSNEDLFRRALRLPLTKPSWAAGRDQDIATYIRFARSRASDSHCVVRFSPRIRTPQHGAAPRYNSRQFDLDDFRKRVEKQQFDREYTSDEIWANYTYFMKAVLPVAEEPGSELALTPTTRPSRDERRRVFTHYDGYHRAEQIAGNSRTGADLLRRHVVRRRQMGRTSLR